MIGTPQGAGWGGGGGTAPEGPRIDKSKDFGTAGTRMRFANTWTNGST
jgi:hypothetical protein